MEELKSNDNAPYKMLEWSTDSFGRIVVNVRSKVYLNNEEAIKLRDELCRLLPHQVSSHT